MNMNSEIVVDGHLAEERARPGAPCVRACPAGDMAMGLGIVGIGARWRSEGKPGEDLPLDNPCLFPNRPQAASPAPATYKLADPRRVPSRSLIYSSPAAPAAPKSPLPAMPPARSSPPVSRHSSSKAADDTALPSLNELFPGEYPTRANHDHVLTLFAEDLFRGSLPHQTQPSSSFQPLSVHVRYPFSLVSASPLTGMPCSPAPAISQNHTQTRGTRPPSPGSPTLSHAAATRRRPARDRACRRAASPHVQEPPPRLHILRRPQPRGHGHPRLRTPARARLSSSSSHRPSPSASRRHSPRAHTPRSAAPPTSSSPPSRTRTPAGGRTSRLILTRGSGSVPLLLRHLRCLWRWPRPPPSGPAPHTSRARTHTPGPPGTMDTHTAKALPPRAVGAPRHATSTSPRSRRPRSRCPARRAGAGTGARGRRRTASGGIVARTAANASTARAASRYT